MTGVGRVLSVESVRNELAQPVVACGVVTCVVDRESVQKPASVEKLVTFRQWKSGDDVQRCSHDPDTACCVCRMLLLESAVNVDVYWRSVAGAVDFVYQLLSDLLGFMFGVSLEAVVNCDVVSCDVDEYPMITLD